MATKKRTHHKGLRKRFSFARIPTIIDIPNLIEIQQRSYQRFLQHDMAQSERTLGGVG